MLGLPQRHPENDPEDRDDGDPVELGDTLSND
jgi:hypothetical protein